MLQKAKDILDNLRTPLQSAAVVFLFLAAFIVVLWIIMVVVRVVIG